jgi:hypothetical protein
MMIRRRPDDLQLPAEGPLADLLADACAPGHPGELVGLGAALTAFHAHQTRRVPMKALLANAVAAKLLIGAVGAASLGGVSLAAASGDLPDPAQQAAHDLVGAPAPGNSADHRQDGNHRPSTEPSDEATPDATPSPSMVGLCRAYAAGVADSKGKALDNPAFTVLLTNAGGKEGVEAYCATVLADAPGGKPTALPTQAQNHKPAPHVTGAPDSHAGDHPNDHATGRP